MTKIHFIHNHYASSSNTHSQYSTLCIWAAQNETVCNHTKASLIPNAASNKATTNVQATRIKPGFYDALHVRTLLVPAVVVMLVLFGLVLELAAEDGASNGSQNTVATQLVAAKVASSTATKGAHQSAVALCLRIGVSGSILAGRVLARSIVALGILVLGVGALLRELVRRLCARVLSLWGVLLLLAVSDKA